MKSYFWGGIFALLAFSCASSTQEISQVTSFPVMGKLTASIIPISKPILLPRYIGCLTDYLIVYKEKEEHLFSFFRLDDGTYLNESGTRGQGPDVFNMLDSRSFDTECGHNLFSVMEAGSNLHKNVRYDGNGLSVVNTKAVFAQGISNNGFYELMDSVYLTLGRIESNNEFCLLNMKTGKLEEKGDYPKWINSDEVLHSPPLFVPYLKVCAVHPDKSKFIVFYMGFKRFRIYDNSLNLLHDVDVQINPCHTAFGEEMQNQPVYYIAQPYATHNHIYVLCANQHTGVERYELQVWGWDGQPVACFSLDRKLSMMAISLQYNKIYALDNLVDNELYVYDLPKLE